MRRFLFRPWTVALALLALCAVSYGLLAGKLGYYWDDWTIVWYIHFLGPSSFPAAFAFDRPLLAPIYMLTTSLLGESPLSWQIFAIFTRWLACLALWWTLRAVWPKFEVETACVAFLFAVYPGFKQQYIAITYGNAFLVLALYLASWGLMVWALRKPRWFWQFYLVSILVSIYAVFTAEHYFGLEFLRPVFLWLALGNVSQKVGQAFSLSNASNVGQASSMSNAGDVGQAFSLSNAGNVGQAFSLSNASNVGQASSISNASDVGQASSLSNASNVGQASSMSNASDVGQAFSLSTPRQRLKRAGLLWIPYLVIDLLFLVWRIAYPTPRAKITLFSDLKASPLSTILNLGQTALQDIYKSSAQAWQQTLDFSWLSGYPSTVLVQYAAIVGGVFIALAVFLLLLKSAQTSSPQSNTARRRWGWQAVGLGLFALLLAGVPIWPTDLRIELFFPWDRFTLPMMLGASLLLVGLFELIGWRLWLSILLVSAAAGLGAGLHFQNALEFRKDWLMQREFFWQLAWRAPSIKPGTVLLTSELPFPYDWDNSLIAPLNWTYAPQLQGRELPYLIYNAESRLSSGLPDLQKDTQITEELRITPFKGSIAQTVLFFYRPPGSCLKVIDPLNDQNLPDKPRYFKDIYTFSDPGLIGPGVARPTQRSCGRPAQRSCGRPAAATIFWPRASP